jgi:DNA-binding response OmpR family regulator
MRVLYVDDELDFLTLGELFLRDDFDVDTTTDPEEVIEMIRKNGYDVVISDYQMPKMNGIELSKKIREEFPYVSFVLFSGKGKEDLIIEAFNNGIDHFVQKGGSPTTTFTELKYKVKQAVKEVRTIIELIEANKKLILAGSVARHAINNNLTAITGYLSLVLEIEKEETSKKYLLKIEEAADRIKGEVKNI